LFGLSSLLMTDSDFVHVTLIQRTGKRALRNDGALLALLQTMRLDHSQVKVTLCCDGVQFADQLRIMSTTDVLVGVHGAGLLHALHVGIGRAARCRAAGSVMRRPVVMHIASRRLNYHEQVVIERLILAMEAGDDKPCDGDSPHMTPSFLTTRAWTPHSEPEAAWQDDFALSADDLVRIADRAIRSYLSG